MVAMRKDAESASHTSLQGQTPQVQMALDLFNILNESDINLRQPVALEKQLLKDQRMDSDVGKSMLQLLQVCSSAATS